MAQPSLFDALEAPEIGDEIPFAVALLGFGSLHGLGQKGLQSLVNRFGDGIGQAFIQNKAELSSTLATFSTMYEPHAEYSRDFLRNIKDEYGHDEQFWAKYLCSTLYFTGLYENINYITSYPCHSQGDFPEVLIEPVTRFAKCFRGNYIPDLIVRHTTATKSQTSRATVDHLNQLRTIRLNPNPLKRGTERYASSPLCSGKTVLVIDDVCSKGMSFEAARAYLEATGCRVISVALLKALRHGYEALHQLQMRPYQTNTPTAVRVRKTYPYRDHLLSDAAAVELRDRLRRYRRWDWPNGSTHA